MDIEITVQEMQMSMEDDSVRQDVDGRRERNEDGEREMRGEGGRRRGEIKSFENVKGGFALPCLRHTVKATCRLGVGTRNYVTSSFPWSNTNPTVGGIYPLEKLTEIDHLAIQDRLTKPLAYYAQKFTLAAVINTAIPSSVPVFIP